MSEIENAATSVRVIRIIWLALLTSIIIYGLIIFIAVPRSTPQPLEKAFSDPQVIIVHGLGIAMWAMAFVIPSFLGRRPAGMPPSFASRPADVVKAGPLTRTRLITRWAMIESAAIFGLVCAFLMHDPRLFLPLGGLAVAGMLISYPGDTMLREMEAA